MLSLTPIIAGIVAMVPSARVEWNAMVTVDGWACTVWRGDQAIATAAGRTGLEAAIQVLGRIWAEPGRKARGRRT